MYSSHSLPKENDELRRESKEDMSSSNTYHQDKYMTFSYNTFFSDLHGDYEKSPMPSCNTDFYEQSTDKHDQASYSRTSWYNETFRQPTCSCCATDISDKTQNKAHTSNNSDKTQKNTNFDNQASWCGDGERNMNHNGEGIPGEYTGGESSVPRGKRSRKGNKKKPTDTQSAEKCKNEDKQNDVECDDDNVNKSKQDTLKNNMRKEVKEQKRPNRTKRGNMHKKSSNMSRVNRFENSNGDTNWSWLFDEPKFILLKTGLAKMGEIIPMLISGGLSVLWYILVLVALFVCFILSCLVSLLYKISAFFLAKTRAVKADYDKFAKKKNDVHVESQQSHQPDLGSSDEIVSQLLASRHLSAYDVLGVSELPTDEEIKRKYRDMAKIVHPDKNAHPESGEAFQILQSAFEMISDEEKRVAYQFNKEQRRFQDDFGDFIDLMKQHLKSKLMCSTCNKSHPRLSTDRLANAARYCAQCNVKHSAKEGDVWVETSHMGFKYYCYLCMDDQVFEVTEWASCQDLLRHCRPNAHGVYLSVKSNRPSYSPWDDLFGETDQSPNRRPNQNNKKKQKSSGKNKAKSSGKNKKR